MFMSYNDERRQQDEEEQRSASAKPQENPNIRKLDEVEGFELLLVTVKLLENNETANYIIGMSEERTRNFIKKAELTTMDFERKDIIHFLDDQEATADVIDSAKQYFKSHFITNEKMKKLSQKFSK